MLIEQKVVIKYYAILIFFNIYFSASKSQTLAGTKTGLVSAAEMKEELKILSVRKAKEQKEVSEVL